MDDTAASTRRMNKDPYFYMKVKLAMEIKYNVQIRHAWITMVPTKILFPPN
jgi:hypothetical protein